MKTIAKYVKKFLKRSDGGITFEGLIVFLPVLGTWMTMIYLFGYVSIVNTMERSGSAIAEMFSRIPTGTPITAAYLDATQQLVAELTNSNPEELSLRITALTYELNLTGTSTYDAALPEAYYRVDFSEVRNGTNVAASKKLSGFTNGDFNPTNNDWSTVPIPNLPLAGDGEQMMVIEFYRPFVYDYQFTKTLLNLGVQYVTYPRFGTWTYAPPPPP